jgi:AcrR family transcriptional regulator
VAVKPIPSKPTQDTTAQTIVRAALECLEQYGLEGLTIRKIAAHANVNVAAINYHFRTKEKLLEQVYELAIANSFQDINERVTAQAGKALETQLGEFLLHYATGAVEYPNITRVMIHELISAGQGQRIVSEGLEVFLQDLAERFARLQGRDPNDLEVRFKTVQVMSVLICLGLIPDVLKTSLGLDTQQPKMRAKLVEYLMVHQP